jgi:hypothetical protein
MPDDKHKLIRRAQTISPFGVGSILDFEGESFVAVDIYHWKGKGEEIHEPRLEKLLGVTKFIMAPAAPDNRFAITDLTPGIPYHRFPRWMFCPGCRGMEKTRSSENPPTCQTCTDHPKLVPMRFVMACPRGHLTDVPWDFWAHSITKKEHKGHHLKFIALPGGSGLEYLKVECTEPDCHSSRDLGGIASRDSLMMYKIRCPGLQPWQLLSDAEVCDAVPQVLQRGATNLTFASVESSIEIPPDSTYETYYDLTLLVTNHPMSQSVQTYLKNKNPIAKVLIDQIAADIKEENEDFDISPTEVENVLLAEIKGISPTSRLDLPKDVTDLMYQEFSALTAPDIRYDSRDRFIKRTIDLTDYPPVIIRPSFKVPIDLLKSQIDRLVQVPRLREIRALKGFSRLGPPDEHSEDEDEPAGIFSTYGSGTISPLLVRSDLGKLPFDQKWLPAIEVFGEGIFVSLDEKALQTWEKNPSVQNRVKNLLDRRNEHAFYLPEPNPRLVLLHTLSHLLIRQLSFECGYSIASLRERIYSTAPSENQEAMAGILIYTAAGDSEGTLGGLVREGKANRIFPTFFKALQSAEWCSSDPLCRESHGQGLHNLNLAACHACSLLPETSCVMSNRLLDRILLIGDTEETIKGFFSPLLGCLRA